MTLSIPVLALLLGYSLVATELGWDSSAGKKSSEDASASAGFRAGETGDSESGGFRTLGKTVGKAGRRDSVRGGSAEGDELICPEVDGG